MNTNLKLTLGDVYKDGQKLFGKVAGPMIGFWFIMLIFLSSFSSVSELFGKIPYVGAVVYQLLVQFITVSLSAGFIVYMNLVYTNSKYSFNNFFQGFPFGPKLLLSSILKTFLAIPLVIFPLAIIATQINWSTILSDFSSPESILSFMKSLFLNGYTIFGIILFALCSCFFMLLTQFSDNLIVLKQSEIIESIKESVRGVWSNIDFFLKLYFFLGLINILGALLIGLGLIYTVPLSMCILHITYQKMYGTEIDELSDAIDNFGSKEEF